MPSGLGFPFGFNRDLDRKFPELLDIQKHLFRIVGVQRSPIHNLMAERKFTVVTVYRAHFNVRCVNVDIVLLRQFFANVAIPVIVMNGSHLQLGFMVIIA